jgi:hypothetical protein
VLTEARKLMALQMAETTERNTFNGLLGLTQVNYINSRGARASLVTGDVLNTFEITRAFAQLVTLGAPRFMGDEMTNAKIDADGGGAQASADPRGRPHYTAIIHPFAEADLTQNSTFVLASSYSDVNKLYNYEVGQWHGVRFCSTNMAPYWVGAAGITGTASATGGSLATGTHYQIIVTQSDTINQYETIISQQSADISVTGPTGSISVALPTVYGYTYNVYVSNGGVTASPTIGNLALCAAGPTQGPLQGQAVQLTPGQTVVLTGVGLAQTPPAAPATNITVYSTFVIGRGAYAQVVLDDVKITLLDKADKSDPHNQLRVIGWKMFYGFLIKNNLFDTIYQEHYSYFSLHSIKNIFEKHGLKIFHIGEIPTHGGSFRIYARHANENTLLDISVVDILSKEKSFGILDPRMYFQFGSKVENVKGDLLDLLISLKKINRTVVGYGAPAKGNTLLNYCGIRSDLLKYTVDINPHKQGLFLPGTHIPIKHPNQIEIDQPDYVLILPWNIKNEIMEQLSPIRKWKGKFIILLPRVEII